jgi:hypothetical protein
LRWPMIKFTAVVLFLLNLTATSLAAPPLFANAEIQTEIEALF